MIELPSTLTDQEKYFDRLEAIYMDPLIRKVIDQAKVYNELLAQEHLTDDEITQIVNELDGQWMLLLGEDATVTGDISFIDVDDLSGDAEPTESYHENQDARFNGFVARTIDTRYKNGSLITDGDEDVSTYELRIQLTKEALNSQGEVVIMTGSAAIDSLLSLEFQQMMSPERAREWLSHFHPDVIDEIDVCLLNPSLEECEMVMRLKDMVIDLSGLHDTSQDMIGISKVALGVYVESLFDFDDAVPYTITAKGEAWSFNEFGAVVSSEIEAASLAKVRKIIWQPGTEDDDHIVRPQLDVTFLGATKDSEDLHLLVPLSTIEDFASIRYDYFYGYPELLPETA